MGGKPTAALDPREILFSFLLRQIQDVPVELLVQGVRVMLLRFGWSILELILIRHRVLGGGRRRADLVPGL